MSKVLITAVPLYHLDGEYAHVLRTAGFDVVYPIRKGQLSEAELIEQLAGVQAVIAGSDPFTANVLAKHPQLRVIARAGVGYDAVDLNASTEIGAAVTITPNTNQDAVAEHTFALMLAVAKSLVPQHLGTIALRWPRQATLPLRGRTLGIAGLGRIGKAVALRGKVFGMKLIAYEPFPDQAFAAEHGVTFVTLDELFRQSDYLTLHMPSTPESKYLICKKNLELMKPTSFLFNTARGSIVNEADLIEALNAKKIAGAGLDVFEQEPPSASPLFQMDNVVATPHAAGVDLQSRDDMALSAAQAIISLRDGEWLAEKVVNPAVRAKFVW